MYNGTHGLDSNKAISAFNQMIIGHTMGEDIKESPQSNDELEFAVDLWYDDNEAAFAGPINDWDVSLIG